MAANESGNTTHNPGSDRELHIPDGVRLALELWRDQGNYAWVEGKQILEVLDFWSHKGNLEWGERQTLTSVIRFLVNAAIPFSEEIANRSLEQITQQGLDEPAQVMAQLKVLDDGHHLRHLRLYINEHPLSSFPVGKHAAYHQDLMNGKVDKAVVSEMTKVRILRVLKQWSRDDTDAAVLRGIIQPYLDRDADFIGKNFVDVDSMSSAAPRDVDTSFVINSFLLDAVVSIYELSPSQIAELLSFTGDTQSEITQRMLSSMKAWGLYGELLNAAKEDTEGELPFETNAMVNLLRKAREDEQPQEPQQPPQVQQPQQPQAQQP